MILNRLKDILKATINDQIHNNSAFTKILQDDIDLKDIDWDNFFKSSSAKEESDDSYDQYQSSYQYQETEYSQEYKSHSEINKEKEMYAALEVPYGSSFVEIKKSYRRLMKIYHPDLYHNEPDKMKAAQEVSLKLNEAYNYFEIKLNK